MLYLAIKALVSGVMVMAVSELARRSAARGALVASLPLVPVDDARRDDTAVPRHGVRPGALRHYHLKA